MSEKEVIQQIIEILIKKFEKNMVQTDYDDFKIIAKTFSSSSDEEINNVHEKYKEIYFSDELNKKYKKMYEQACASIFSDEEMNDILLFFKSKSGISYLEKQSIFKKKISEIESNRSKEASLKAYELFLNKNNNKNINFN